MIVFRNYIQAAVIAHTHSATLGNLITAEELATITIAALNQFQKKNNEKEDSGKKLRGGYREDAERACDLLTQARLNPSVPEEIRRILKEKFQ